MKKLAVFFVIISVISIITVPVFAAQAAQVSISASKGTVNAGDTFTITVSTSAVKNCVSGGFMFSYDMDIFEYASGKALVKGFTMSGVTDMAGSLSGYFMNISGSNDIQGDLFQVTFRVKATAASGNYTISGTPNITVKNGDVKESIACSVDSAAVTVIGCAHKWGGWVEFDNTQHSRTCSVCNSVDTTAHSWNSGKTTRQPTCKDTGERVLTCLDCNATTAETLAVLTAHTYDHDCDVDCNVCGATRVITHQYKTTWNRNKESHWYECSVCKEKKDLAAHTPGEEATNDHAQTCTVCGYILTPALSHQHDYATDWSTDEAGHWYACLGCEEKNSYTNHSFENDCDADCSVCGYTRATEHIFDETMRSDATHHWLVCVKCGYEHHKAPHEPGPEATVTASQACTICDYVIMPALDVSDTTNPTELPGHGANGQAMLPVLIAAIAVCAAAACFLMIILIKKISVRK